MLHFQPIGNRKRQTPPLRPESGVPQSRAAPEHHSGKLKGEKLGFGRPNHRNGRTPVRQDVEIADITVERNDRQPIPFQIEHAQCPVARRSALPPQLIERLSVVQRTDPPPQAANANATHISANSKHRFIGKQNIRVANNRGNTTLPPIKSGRTLPVAFRSRFRAYSFPDRYSGNSKV